jgi:hypothetical protein
MSEQEKPLEFERLSEKLHLFICPLFTEVNPDARKKISALRRGTDKGLDQTDNQPSVRLAVDPPQLEGQRLPAFEDMAIDLIRDFGDFLSSLNTQTNAGWDMDSLRGDIALGISNSQTVFSDDACWFHISHSNNQIVMDFAGRFFREDQPGIVFGYYHKKQSKDHLGTDESVTGYMSDFRNKVDASGFPNGNRNESPPSLEVSLRVPIKKPRTEDLKYFVDWLEQIRKCLRQESIAIFDEENLTMHYLGSDGWSTGGSKFIEPRNTSSDRDNDIHEFLSHVGQLVKEAASIIPEQPDTVLNPRRNGIVIPANHSYLYDLYNQPHLGFSFFPPVQQTSNGLANRFLLESGRWLWNSVFPYRTTGVVQARINGRQLDTHDRLFVLLHTIVGGGPGLSIATYARYRQDSNCLCGRCYPGNHLATVPTARIGPLRSDCNNGNNQVDAGDPEAVLSLSFPLQPLQAEQAWNTALTDIS